MRIIKFLIWLFLLCSCNSLHNRTIAFSSYAVSTKAMFGEDVEHHQQIIWEEQDDLIIHSDKAVNENGDNFAIYNVANIVNSGHRSYGKIVGEKPLMWGASGTYNFWAAYPSNVNIENGIITYNDKALIAHTSCDYGKDKVDLLFYPAFTTFKFEINGPVSKVWIESETPLVGTYKGAIDDIIRGQDVLYENTSNVVMCDSNFIAYCLPINISGITIYCELDNGNVKKTEFNYQFLSCKQYRIEMVVDELTDGIIEIVRCCSFIKYGYNEIRNMSLADVKSAIESDSELKAEVLNFIRTTEVLHSNLTLNGNISASDFKAFKSLKRIEYIDVGQNAEIEIVGLDIDAAEFNHGLHYIIKDCEDLTNVKLYNIDNNLESTIEIDNCPNIKFFGDIGWNAQKCKFILNGLSGLEEFYIHNAKAITIKNCESLKTIKVDQATNLEELWLENLPNLESGIFIMADKHIDVYTNNIGNTILSFSGNGGN